jgi:hypothetical protein
MIKVFNSQQEFSNYTQGGMVAGDLYYVLADGSVHFRTNNIDGTDKVYDKADGGSEPEYTEIESVEGTANIPCAKGDVLEIICSDEDGLYVAAAVFDANMELVDEYVQAQSMSTNTYTWYVLISKNNAAFLSFMNSLGTDFTASYRKIN